jgi:hypothetical protein
MTAATRQAAYRERQFMAGSERVAFMLDLQTRQTISALANHYCTNKRDTIKRVIADAGRALLKNKEGTNHENVTKAKNILR